MSHLPFGYGQRLAGFGSLEKNAQTQLHARESEQSSVTELQQQDQAQLNQQDQAQLNQQDQQQQQQQQEQLYHHHDQRQQQQRRPAASGSLMYERIPLPPLQGGGVLRQPGGPSAFYQSRGGVEGVGGVGGSGGGSRGGARGANDGGGHGDGKASRSSEGGGGGASIPDSEAPRKSQQFQRQRQQEQQQQQMVASLPLVGQDRSFLRRSQPQLPPPSGASYGVERQQENGRAPKRQAEQEMAHRQASFARPGPPQLLSAQQLQQERQQIMSAAHSGEQQSREALVLVEVEQLEELCRTELKAIEEFKKHIKSGVSSLSGTDGEMLICQFRADILNRIWKKKTRALSYICEGVSEPSVFGLSSSREQLSVGLMAVIQQPSDVAVVNRYILPSPKLHVSTPPSPGCSLFVAARVVYSDNRSRVNRTSDDKHDMLQGIVRVPVDTAGFVLFNKIKIMEVTRKHKMRPFALEFSLEEMTAKGDVRTLASIQSMPFTVQSRPNKRLSTSGSAQVTKRAAVGEVSPYRFATGAARSDGGAMLLPVVGYDRSLPNLSIPQKRMEPQAAPVSNTSSLLSVPTPASSKGKVRNAKSRSVDSMLDHYYIDITKLLVLPQKDAAKRLGISESMLCKRFKETTSRKWPYRYLRKIEKVISMLQGQQLDGPLSSEDSEKLKKLLTEKEECLQPVRIRITSYDKVIGRHQGGRALALALNGSGSGTTVAIAPKRAQQQPACGEEAGVADEEEMANVLQTMKSSRERLGAPRHDAAEPPSQSPSAPMQSMRPSNLPLLQAQQQGPIVLPQPQSPSKLSLITPTAGTGSSEGPTTVVSRLQSGRGRSPSRLPARSPPRLE